MSAGIATPRPERLIPALTGFITAPDWMSDEEVAYYRAPRGGFSLTKPCALSERDRESLARSISSRLLSGGDQTNPLAQRWAECPIRRLSPSLACLCEVFRARSKRAQTKLSKQIPFFRISMVVVAIAMVVGLRVLVNQHSKHTRTDGEGV